MIAALLALLLFAPGTVHALEPVSAFDDGFAVPSATTLTEAAFGYPGAESFIGEAFAAGAWSVPYGVSDLAVSSAIAGYGHGGFGLSLAYTGTGFDLYGDEQEKVGVSWGPVKRVSAGVRLTRTAMRIRGFGEASAWSSDIGVILRPADKVFLAGSWEDVASAELGDSEEPLDGRVRFAASWEIDDHATLIASANKVRRFDVSYSAGLTVTAADVLTLGMLGANEPDRFEYLCGVTFGNAQTSYRGSYHRDLGATHGFFLSWKANR